LARRRESAYPWDPEPIEEVNRLLGRVRVVLPSAPADLPVPPTEARSGRSLWRTPTDDALDALENLRAAVLTAHEQPGGTERH
jgi:hypothetical protein